MISFGISLAVFYVIVAALFAREIRRAPILTERGRFVAETAQWQFKAGPQQPTKSPATVSTPFPIRQRLQGLRRD